MGSLNRVLSRVTVVMTRIRGLITSLITTHEPPSNYCNLLLSRFVIKMTMPMLLLVRIIVLTTVKNINVITTRSFLWW